jgi:hypothetical protein
MFNAYCAGICTAAALVHLGLGAYFWSVLCAGMAVWNGLRAREDAR